MGGGTGRLALACGLAALALFAAGCGAEENPNEPRAQPPTRVSVTIRNDAVTVQPTSVATGPEPTQQIPQNSRVAQPRIRSRSPLTVVFVTANLTPVDSRLKIRGPRRATSGPLVANGTGSLQVALPAGTYTLSAAGMPRARTAKLTVGPYRTSSQNDLLLP